MPFKRNYKGDTPIELREFIYTTREAIQYLQIGYATYFRYQKYYPISMPTSKAALMNWIQRLGFPRYPPITLHTEDQIRYIRSSNKSTRELAKILGICQTRVVKLSHARLPKEAS